MKTIMAKKNKTDNLGSLNLSSKTDRGRVRIIVGDCRAELPAIKEVKARSVRLIFADPPFNWNRDYDRQKTGRAWVDKMADDDYLALRASGSTCASTH